MQNLYRKLLQLSKSNLSIQDKLKHKQLLDQLKVVIDKKKRQTANNIHSGVGHARSWMEEFTGLDKVHAAQTSVSHYQDMFMHSQSKRRELGSKLTALQLKLNELHNEIMDTDRRTEKYLQLITREHKLLKEEEDVRNKFNLTEGEERENFTLFTTKIKESQDMEREQALRTKYWTIVISTAVTLIGILGNGIISWAKMHALLNNITEFRAETRSLNANMSNTLSTLDANQSVVVTQILAQISQTIKEIKVPGTQKQMDQLLDLLWQTNIKLDNLGRVNRSMEKVANPSEAGIAALLQQIATDIELLKSKQMNSKENPKLEEKIAQKKDSDNSEHVPATNQVEVDVDPNVLENAQSGGFFSSISNLGASTYNLASKVGSGTYNAVTGIASNPTVQTASSSTYNKVSNAVTNPKETISSVGTGIYNLAATVGSTTKDAVSGVLQTSTTEIPSVSNKTNSIVETSTIEIPSVSNKTNSIVETSTTEIPSVSNKTNSIVDTSEEMSMVSNKNKSDEIPADEDSAAKRFLYFTLASSLVVAIHMGFSIRFPNP